MREQELLRPLKEEEVLDALGYIVGELRDCNTGIYKKLATGELTLEQAMKAAEFVVNLWDEDGEAQTMEMVRANMHAKKG
jgi:hypothetical protein